METFDVISKRRSIRKFIDKDIPIELIKKILNSAMQAPSAKNRQPWKFIVVTNNEKVEMLEAMQAGIENERNHLGLLPNSLQFLNGAQNTMKMMEQAPITVFVFNTADNYFWDETTIENKFSDMANIQSIGASIENMLLAATDLGIGSLWICDIFFAYREICKWLNEKNQLVAAISLGYANENPNPRPRKKLDDIVEWR
ncbi:MAG: nitroreductase family protein [Cellulosilyticaceae bacterium]